MKRLSALFLLILLFSLVTGCAAPTPQVINKEVTVVVPEKIVETVIVAGTPQVVEKVVTATPVPEAQPAPGGTLVIATGIEPDSLDVHRSQAVAQIMKHMGASLVAKDPETGEFVPYLAESWTASPDAMTFEFKLRTDVKFHDGTPLTAQDYAWTFNRAVAQNPPSTAGGSLRGFQVAEAVDDATLRLKFAIPSANLLDTLALQTWHQPLAQAYVEKLGDAYGRKPMGVGPYKFKEWVTGQKIVLERNPDFNWGPAFTHGGPAYVETIEFRIVPEYATQLAGLEAGEVDQVFLETKDAKRLRDAGKYQIFETMGQGSGYILLMNTAKAPFNDLNVRQAINCAINRDMLVKVVGQGEAVVSYGPLTPATLGYWPGVQYVGYGYDPDRARALLAAAGYEPNAAGVLEKNSAPLSIQLQTFPVPDWIKIAEILQQQLQAVGIASEIQQQETGVGIGNLVSGNYDMGINAPGWPDYGLLFGMYHPSTMGAFNYSQLNDPELNPLLELMAGAPNRDVALAKAAEAQRRIVEQAYIAPLFVGKSFSAVRSRVKDVIFSPVEDIYLFDAYINTTTE